MWAKARGVSRLQATVELSHEFGLLNEAEARRLLLALGRPESTRANRPKWDAQRGELVFDGPVIRRVSNLATAMHVVTLLNVFEELGWPSRIDDPLPHGSDKERLRDAIKSLNWGLSKIRIRADGTGTGIIWECAGSLAAPVGLP